MIGTVRRRLAIALVATLVVMLAAPLGALAKPAARTGPANGQVTAQWSIDEDIYEPDNTVAQAKVLPEVSFHSFPSGEATDMAKITAEATGTPFVLETQFLYGDGDTVVTVYSLDASGALVEEDSDDDSALWSFGSGSTVFFSAPKPGTYYVSVTTYGAFVNQEYALYITKGIARRIAGMNRFDTAAQVSQTMFADAMNGNWGTGNGPAAVLVTNGYNFPDALAAGALGAIVDTDSPTPLPILLTGANSLPEETAAEIERLAFSTNYAGGEFTVYVVGGAGAVSDDVFDEIAALEFVDDVERIAGADRFATASEVATTMADWYGSSDTAFLVNGYAFADALAAGPVAGYNWSPILLTRTSSVPSATLDFLTGQGVSNVVIVGGEAAVSTSVASVLATEPYNLNVTRVAGANRYETARLLAVYGIDNFGMSADSITLVSGTSFPDGLAAAPMTGFTQGPVLLTGGSSLASSVETFYANEGPTADPSYVVGGSGAVSDTVYNRFKSLWSVYPPMP